jgi:hypothetical protein
MRLNRFFALLFSLLMVVLAIDIGRSHLAQGSEPAAEKSSQLLRQVVDRILKDAVVETDPEYQALLKQPTSNLAAPSDMRRVILDWSKDRRFNNWPNELRVNFEDQKLTFLWSGTLPCGEEVQFCRQKFVEMLAKQGYLPLEKEQVAAFEEKWTARVGDQHGIQIRKNGETEILVSFEVLPAVGSRLNRSMVNFTWFARSSFQAAKPKLADAIAVLPAWMKATYLDDKFYSLLGSESIDGMTSGRNISISFTQPIQDKLVAALEQTGFDFSKEHSPQRNGNVQKSWTRFSDLTYAHVVSSADEKGAQFTCQTPQRKGDPVTMKPPPGHPSLKLPFEKRPILKLNQLEFIDDKFQRRVQLFHELFDQLAPKTWEVQLYKDMRYTPTPLYTAYWQSSKVVSTQYLLTDRPYESLTINLKRTDMQGLEPLNSIEVRGVLVSLQGWAATISYREDHFHQGKKDQALFADVRLAEQGQVFSFGTLQFARPSVRAEANETEILRYRFEVLAAPQDFQRTLKTLYDTPEILRDHLLENLAMLRLRAREHLEAGTDLVAYDHSNVRSDNPPRPASTSKKHPFSEKTKKAILDDIERQLTTQEAFIRGNFRPIHAAIQQALPLQKMREELSGDK